MVGAWVLRDLYEVVPNDYLETVSGGRAGVQYLALGGTTKITGVAWYRGSTSGDPPVSLSVWDRQQAVRLWKTTDVPDDGTIGWHEVDLTDTPLIAGMFQARVGAGAYWADGGQFSAKQHDADLLAEPGANIPLQFAFRHEGSGDVTPATVATARIYPLDLRVEPWTGASAGGGGDTATLLASYLTATGENYAGSPLADIHTVTEDTYNQASDNATAIAAVKADTQSLLDRLTEAWRDTVASNTEGIPGFLLEWDAFYTQFVDITAPAVADLVEAVGDFTGISVFGYLAALIRFANGIDAPPQLAEGPDWELIDETDFDTHLMWPVEADLYRVTISAFDPAGTDEPVGTETRHGYLGKWTTLNVTFFGEWHWFNTVHGDLENGRRMPGLGLRMYRPGTGHVQAWRRKEGA